VNSCQTAMWALQETLQIGTAPLTFVLSEGKIQGYLKCQVAQEPAKRSRNLPRRQGAKEPLYVMERAPHM